MLACDDWREPIKTGIRNAGAYLLRIVSQVIMRTKIIEYMRTHGVAELTNGEMRVMLRMEDRPLADLLKRTEEVLARVRNHASKFEVEMLLDLRSALSNGDHFGSDAEWDRRCLMLAARLVDGPSDVSLG